MLGQDMIGSMFLYETLVKTLLNLGADWVGVYDAQGYNLVPHRSDPQNPWVAQQVDAGYKFLIQTRAQAGAKFTSRALRILPLPVHASRVMMAVVPGAYVIAHMSGFESWASDALARKLADSIETWVAVPHRHDAHPEGVWSNGGSLVVARPLAAWRSLC